MDSEIKKFSPGMLVSAAILINEPAVIAVFTRHELDGIRFSLMLSRGETIEQVCRAYNMHLPDFMQELENAA